MNPNATTQWTRDAVELGPTESRSVKRSGMSPSSASDTCITGTDADLLAGRKSRMFLSGSTSRLVNYYKRHGFRATLNRTLLFLRRLFSFPRMVLFYYDLTSCGLTAITENRSDGLKVERKICADEIDSRDLQQILNFWNPELSRCDLSKRFQKGASLWLIRSNGELAGYGWTLTGGTIERHYFPLGSNDVHLFDFLVFPEYRGRRINPVLVIHILDQMANEGRTRAYIEAAEWNRAQLASLSKTGFRLLGIARKISLLGRTFVQWGSTEMQSEDQKTQVVGRDIGIHE